MSAGEQSVLDTSTVIDLADPLTSVSLSLEACFRFLDRDAPEIEEAKARLKEAISQCARAQEIYYSIDARA